MHIILTHNNADFDAIASMLAAYKLDPTALPILPVRLNRNVAEFLALYRNGLPFINWHDAELTGVTHITLTDTQTRPALKGVPADTPTLIIEHHPKERDLAPHETWMGETLGAITTLLTEHIQARHIHLTTLEATVLALGIYADTGMLTYGGTTPRDIRAAAWLLEQGASLDTVRRFLVSPLDDVQQTLLETLLSNAQTRTIQGYPITLSSAVVAHNVDGINSITTRLLDMLDPTALCVVVQMPKRTQMVCRSTDDAVNVGELASALGGGGHARAAAAAFESQPPEGILETIWSWLNDHVQPSVRVGDLMSYGVQTVQADDSVRELVPRLRRIGHEGYPVLEDGRVVGLLTRRDADRVMEHGLNKATVREVMQSGTYSLSPHDSVFTLEQMMLNSGWGQLPVVENGELIGIVTRTDLIKYWAQTHPNLPPTQPSVSEETLVRTLGSDTVALIEAIATTAQARSLSVSMVGGVVRDLLLGRANLDIDFVVEGDAIGLAHALRAAYGGDVTSFAPFGTAKWLIGADTVQKLGLGESAHLPQSVDFATARNEFYAHPTALPTVYSGSIKLDLGRRDFTINTLALQISPRKLFGRILDFYGGMNDLTHGVVRVLHSLSFVDDPTRILRAVRFSQRLGFTIEARTRELIHTALPMLARITGERLRNEITLFFREQTPETMLWELQQMGATTAIHPRFVVPERILQDFPRLRSGDHPGWSNDLPALYWHVLLSGYAPDALNAITQRLHIGQTHVRTMQRAAALLRAGALYDPSTPPSALVKLLDGAPPLVLLTVWLLCDDAQARAALVQYVERWQHVQPHHDGHALKARGLPPSPHYKRILDTLRTAWLDGKVTSVEEERTLLENLLETARHDRI